MRDINAVTGKVPCNRLFNFDGSGQEVGLVYRLYGLSERAGAAPSELGTCRFKIQSIPPPNPGNRETSLLACKINAIANRRT